MNMIGAYSANTDKVGINGVPLAGVTLAEEYESCEEYPVLGFGDSCPSAMLTFDRRYTVVLERSACVPDGVRPEKLGEFEILVGGTIYSGCRCTEIRRARRPDGELCEKITVRALDRQEAEDNE